MYMYMYVHRPVFGSAKRSAVTVPDGSDENGGNQRSKVSPNAAEGEAEIHALGEEGVHPALRCSPWQRQVCLQHLQKLPHLHTHTHTSDIHV